MIFKIENAVVKSIDNTNPKVARVEIEYTETYQDKTFTNGMVLNAFKDNIRKAAELLGCYVDVKFTIRMNEYNDKKYNEIGIFAIDAHYTPNWSDKRNGEQIPRKPIPMTVPASELEPQEDDLPFE